ncbi:MAG: sugar ABC transporter permease [Actinomycetota bacterium]
MRNFIIFRKKENKKNTSLKKFSKSDMFWGYSFIAPSILSFLIFNFIAIIASFLISFTDWRLIASPNFVGLANYQKLFTDPVFPKAMINTAIYTFFSVPLGVFMALLLAVVLNQKIRGLPFFRVLYYTPAISSSVAVAMVWMWIYSTDYGILNYILGLFGISPVDWLNNTKTVLLAVSTVSIWKDLGFKIIILLAALQDVPKDMIEAAEIDGAGWWKRLTHITMPLISPAIFFVSVTGFISAIQSMDLVYNMRFEQDGGPARATTTMAFYIYQVAFSYLRMGYGTTLAIIMFLVILIITYIQWHVRKRFIYLESD